MPVVSMPLKDTLTVAKLRELLAEQPDDYQIMLSDAYDDGEPPRHLHAIDRHNNSKWLLFLPGDVCR